jgi:aldehyde:ferredoxin oxidoreductase
MKGVGQSLLSKAFKLERSKCDTILIKCQKNQHNQLIHTCVHIVLIFTTGMLSGRSASTSLRLVTLTSSPVGLKEEQSSTILQSIGDD